MRKHHIFSLAFGLVLLHAASALAQSYGPPLGRLYLSFDPSVETTTHVATHGSVVDVYLLADIDFGDVGQPGRNLSDGIAGWEHELEWSPIDPAVALLFESTISYTGPNSVDFANDSDGVSPRAQRVGSDQCLSVGSGPTLLTHFEFVYIEQTPGIPAQDIVFSLSELAGGSFVAAPGGNVPGWIECYPFDVEVRFPFNDWGSQITLNPATAFAELSVANYVVPPSVDNGCEEITVDFDLLNPPMVDPGSFEVSFYLSDDAVLDGADTLVETYVVGDMGSLAVHPQQHSFTPSAHEFAGDAYLLIEVDSSNTVPETDETNNTDGAPISIQAPGLSVADIPNDQGLQVRLSWLASPLDVPASPTPLVQYEIYRRITGTAGKPAEAFGAARTSAPSAKLADFDYLGSVPIHGDPEYNIVVPTLEDDVATGFVVRAASTDPFTYFDSCEVEATSVDDITPNAPSFVTADYGASGNQISWDPTNDFDVVAFRVYRDSDPGFQAQAPTLIAEVAGSSYDDAGVVDPWDQHYQVSAVDDAGNESPTTAVSNATAAPSASGGYALVGNLPNPFNPSTRIEFRVPPGGGDVSLRIYDAAGRHVRTLVDGFAEGGTHRVPWDGRDGSGATVRSGTYFYRLEAPDFESTRKMLLLK